MSKRDLAALAALSGMILDLRLANLNQAKQARAQTAARISALQSAEAQEGISLVAARQAALLYDVWADARRRELNTVLARQTADMLCAEDDARKAFGRVDALRRLKERMA